jgi:hypothetical protein
VLTRTEHETFQRLWDEKGNWERNLQGIEKSGRQVAQTGTFVERVLYTCFPSQTCPILKCEFSNFQRSFARYRRITYPTVSFKYHSAHAPCSCIPAKEFQSESSIPNASMSGCRISNSNIPCGPESGLRTHSNSLSPPPTPAIQIFQPCMPSPIAFDSRRSFQF